MEDAKPTPTSDRVRIIACGMIAREVMAVREQLGAGHLELVCLPAVYHHYPEKIAPAMEEAIVKAQAEGVTHIFAGYAECGTMGELDKVCAKYGIERIEGPHCFSFYAGNDAFAERADEDMTSFFMTDFLARQFDAFLMKPLGIDRHPELRDMYFGNYEKLVYIAQSNDPELDRKAEAAAKVLGLAYERRFTGYGDLVPALAALA